MRPFYTVAYHLVGLELRLFHQIKVEGRENVPAGGFLIVANHTSFWDPTTVGWAVEREIFYLGRKSLFKPPFWNWFLPICNVLPIDRSGRDIGGLRRIIRLLQAGRPVLLFPEGTRSGDGELKAAEPGAGLIAAKAGVPILPVRLFGTFAVLSRHARWPHAHPIRVVIGPAFLPDPPARNDRKGNYRQVAEEMMRRIGTLR